MDQNTVQALGHVSNGLATAFVLLTQRLEAAGALPPGDLADAIRATIDYAGAPKSRLDYQVLGNILARIEGKQPPNLTLLDGGKSEPPE